MLTMKSAVEKEKNDLFKEIRHIVASQHECPKHLSMVDLKVIMTILTVVQEAE